MTSHPSDHPKAEPPPIPDGPCCLRCGNWRAPGKDDDFGICTALAVITEKVKFGAERGTVVSIEWAMQQADVPWDHLRTQAYMDGCSRYDERREAA